MRKSEKALLISVALIYLAAVLLLGYSLAVLGAAIGISVLIRAFFAVANRPRSTQQESLDNAGITGLSLNESPRPKS